MLYFYLHWQYKVFSFFHCLIQKIFFSSMGVVLVKYTVYFIIVYFLPILYSCSYTHIFFCLPGDVRNDIYVSLCEGEFNRGAKTADKNVEVTMLVCNKQGQIIPVSMQNLSIIHSLISNN